jgi:hypothetical protein
MNKGEMPTREWIFNAIKAKWGWELQLVMVCEESAELQKEACKILRGDNSETRLNSLASEIADVELMCEQLKWMYHLRQQVEAEKENKLARVCEKLELPTNPVSGRE